MYHGRGPWKFAVQDFRDTGYDWIMYSTINDVALNLLVVVLPGNGTSQLMASALITAWFGLLCSAKLPYKDMANNRMEILTPVR